MINLVDNKVREEILQKLKSKYYLPVQPDCTGKWEPKLKMIFIVRITELSGGRKQGGWNYEYFNVFALVILKSPHFYLKEELKKQLAFLSLE